MHLFTFIVNAWKWWSQDSSLITNCNCNQVQAGTYYSCKIMNNQISFTVQNEDSTKPYHNIFNIEHQRILFYNLKAFSLTVTSIKEKSWQALSLTLVLYVCPSEIARNCGSSPAVIRGLQSYFPGHDCWEINLEDFLVDLGITRIILSLWK